MSRSYIALTLIAAENHENTLNEWSPKNREGFYSIIIAYQLACIKSESLSIMHWPQSLSNHSTFVMELLVTSSKVLGQCRIPQVKVNLVERMLWLFYEQAKKKQPFLVLEGICLEKNSVTRQNPLAFKTSELIHKNWHEGPAACILARENCLLGWNKNAIFYRARNCKALLKQTSDKNSSKRPAIFVTKITLGIKIL